MLVFLMFENFVFNSKQLAHVSITFEPVCHLSLQFGELYN